MMKIFTKFLVLVALSVTFFAPPAYAAGDRQPTHVVLERKDVVNTDYFAAGDTVRISGTVNGDVYVAGGTVLIDGTVNGDVFAAGGTVQISGPVKHDIRAAAGSMTLSSIVGGNVTLAGGTVLVTPEAKITGSVLAGAGTLGLLAPIGRGVTAGAGTLTVNSSVGGDMLLAVDELILQPKTKVAGNLTYWAEREATIFDNVALSGGLTFNQMPKHDAKQAKIAKGGLKGLAAAFAGVAMLMTAVAAAALFLLGIIGLSMFPSFTDRTLRGIQKNPWGSFGLGMVTVIATPVVAVAAMMTVIGIPVGIFLLTALGLLCVIGHIYAALYLGSGAFSAINMSAHRAWQLLIGLLALYLFMLIPVVGWLLHGIVILIGVGAVLSEKHATYRTLRAKRLL